MDSLELTCCGDAIIPIWSS